MDGTTQQTLVSADSHVMLTGDWVKARLRRDLQAVWDEAGRKSEAYAAEHLRGGQPNLELRDFVDPEASEDPGYSEPEARLAAMDRDGVQAEVLFPELGGAKVCHPALMGEAWKEVFQGYNQALADFASYKPGSTAVRLSAAADGCGLRLPRGRAIGARPQGALCADHALPGGHGASRFPRSGLRAAVAADRGDRAHHHESPYKRHTPHVHNPHGFRSALLHRAKNQARSYAAQLMPYEPCRLQLQKSFFRNYLP